MSDIEKLFFLYGQISNKLEAPVSLVFELDGSGSLEYWDGELNRYGLSNKDCSDLWMSTNFRNMEQGVEVLTRFLEGFENVH